VGITVAIVEDDAQTREILAAWIDQAPGFRLAGAWAQAETALTAARQLKPDVVLMDLNLPGMSGVDGAREFKRLLPETQVVVLTVYDDVDCICHALAAGATGYLLKQTPQPDLLKALTEVHNGGSPMNSRIARKVVQCFYQEPGAGETDGGLSHRELEVLRLLAQGFLYKEIAERLQVTIPTVSTYIRRAYEKLHVRSRGQAIAKLSGMTELGPRPRPRVPRQEPAS
jgi:DNA-binding NarL/FixJ family response regulator